MIRRFVRLTKRERLARRGRRWAMTRARRELRDKERATNIVLGFTTSGINGIGKAIVRELARDVVRGALEGHRLA